MEFPTRVSHVVGFWTDTVNNSIYKATGKDSNGQAYYIELKSDADNFILDINGTEQTLFPRTVVQKWLTVVIEPNRVYGIEWSEAEPVYPRENLYPTYNLFPRYLITPFVKEYASIDIDDGGVWNSISTSGDVLMRYIWIEDRAITADEISKFSDLNEIPVWDNETLMLAIFNENLRAGSIASDVPVTGWIVYSIESGSSFLKPILSVGATVNSFVDYTARNQVGIIYYIFPVFGETIGSSAPSNMVVPNWWDWSLIVCDTVDNDTYYQSKTYRFDLDVSSGSMSNNTTFNELQNFTKYAKVQNSSSNYWSGTLSAFIGNCGVTYKDTVERMEELKSLTTDNRDKFLKDRKGNFWKVRLNSAVSEKISDEFIEQAVVVTLGWMEVGDASRSVITNKM